MRPAIQAGPHHAMIPERPVLQTVAPTEWRDANGHMNITYYTLLVTRFLDLLTTYTGFGSEYRKSEGAALFIVETRFRYSREIREGEPVRVTGSFTDVAAKRLAACTIHAGHVLAAEVEIVFLNVDLGSRRSRNESRCIKD